MIRSLSHNGLEWLDVEGPQKEEIETLAQRFSLHQLNVEDCLSKRQLPKMDDHNDNIFVLFHFPVSAKSSLGIATSQVSFFLGSNFLISVHEPNMDTVTKLFQNYQQSPSQLDSLMKSSARLMYQVLDALVDNLFPFLQKVEENLEDISDRVFDEKRSVAAQLSFQRRMIVNLRRMVSPMRRLSTELAIKSQRFARNEDLSEYFGDVVDHIEKTWETLEQSKETIEIYKDTDNILSIETTNKVLSILTLVSTLTIPAVVIGTIYGMNIPMPGALVPGPPNFLGVYTMFWLTMLASIVPAGILFLYFRRRHWL